MRMHIDHYFDFLTYYPACFYNKNSQKVNFSSICVYNTGYFIDFAPQKMIFSSKCAWISSTILTFLPNNPVCFYTKNSQKVNFSSNCANNTGHVIDFSPKTVIFSPKCACLWALFWLFCPIIHCDFTPNIPKKLIFPQIATIIQGTLLTFLPKKVIFPQNAPAYRARFRLFCPIIHCVFTPKNPKKLIFPQIVSII